MRRKFFFFAPLALIALAAFLFIGGEAVTLLWNRLLPSLFGWPAITFWQGLGLLALCRILFGGVGMRGRRGWAFRRRGGRWEGMTPDERERIRQQLLERCGFASSKGESAGRA